MDFIYQNNTFKTLVFLSFLLFNGCTFVGQLAIPMESIDKPSGPYDIGTQIFFWTDESRSEQYTVDPTDFRSLLVQIWYPAQLKEGYKKTTHMVFPELTLSSMARTLNAPTGLVKHGGQLMSSAVRGAHPVEGEVFPLILFSHGDGGVATQNLTQIEMLVSQGYVVIAPNHTYNASITFDKDLNELVYQSNITWREQALHNKKYYANRLIRYRYEDMAFVLDTISTPPSFSSLSNPFYKMIDFDRIGIMGHSMGAGTSYHGLINDARIQSAVALDGWFFPLDQKTFTTETKKPFLHLAQEEFLSLEIEGDINNSESGRINFNIHNTILEKNSNSFMVYIKNSLHYDFTDFKQVYIQGRSFTFPISGLGEVSKNTIKEIMNKSILEFFNHSLKDKAFNAEILDEHKKDIRVNYDTNQ